MISIVVVGAGGFGRETAALIEDINRAAPTWELAGFVDDAPALQGTTVQDYPVLGNVDWLRQQRNLQYVIAIGSSRVRRNLGRRLEQTPLEPATLLHPDAHLHASTCVGAGSIVCRGVTLTVSAQLGRHVILNLHCTVGHDVSLADFTTAYPGVHISGSVNTGQAVELGSGCIVLPGVHIGAETIVGAGAVVNQDLPAGCTAVGVPARPLPS